MREARHDHRCSTRATVVDAGDSGRSRIAARRDGAAILVEIGMADRLAELVEQGVIALS